MTKNIKILLLILFTTVVAGGLIYFFKPENTNLTSELFTVKDTSDIAKIIITQDSSKVVLDRNNPTKTWIIDNKYPANKKAIKKLYQTLTETKISKPVLKSDENSITENLLNKGRKIEIYDFKNNLKKQLIAGKNSDSINGTYMLNILNNKPFIVNIPGLENNLNYRYNSNAIYWLKPEIFSYRPNEIKEITLNYPGDSAKSFKLTIFKDTAKLIGLSDNLPVKQLNLNKVGSYLSYFMNIKFASETNNTEKLKNMLLTEIPFAEITLTDIYKNTKNVKLYKIPDKNEAGKYNLNQLHAIINNEDVVIVKYVDFDLILKDINYFVN